MQIALLGGTGDIGQGLALRWARDTNHDVLIGSREAEKAAAKADEYESELAERGHDVDIAGLENAAAAAEADVAVLSVPAYYLSDTIDAVTDELDETVLVSPAVGMQRDEAGVHYNPPGVGSVTALAAKAAPDDVPVVGAFHNLAAGKLADLDADLDWDVPIVSDDADAKETVTALAEGIEGIRALDAGALANASEVESMTPLLINLAANNEDLHDLGVKFW
ncbi:NADPH-dependent F420 reductase [Salinibaculum rarum]|uniref:NADPH-dependent F420 reductase n=1 Tax=Salinibaculum rarum TaxID=3058903 RepID=UPI00265F34D2|nr:NADPH-dependent F420 reductase [Salinibaculum sp. KK48]